MKFEKKKFAKYLTEVEQDENSEYFTAMVNLTDTMIYVAEAIGKDKYNKVVDVLDQYDEVLIKMVVEFIESKDN